MIYHEFDSFLASYDELREYANTANFDDVESPFDGVTYPGICAEIPSKIKQEIIINITKCMGRMVDIKTMFMRISVKGLTAPHMAHTDNLMGRYSFMLYLNDNANAGTSFLRHYETGMCYAPASQEYLEVAQRDQNNPEAWVRMSSAEMVQNRAIIFDSGFFHCAEPIGGFGTDQKDGRIVLTVFFS